MKKAICAALLCLFATPAFAQDREKGWLDVNFGVAATAQDAITTNASRIISSERATFATAYEFPRGADFDFGGGVMFSPMLGAGVSVIGTAHQSPAGLAIRIPHPTRFNTFATDSTLTDEDLTRTEGSVNFQLMVKAPISNEKVRVRFFGGPSYFRANADAVSEIHYDQVFQALGTGNVVAIDTYDTVKVESTGWGYHAGGDVAIMFTRVFGVGVFARFSQGTVTVEDARILADDPVDVKVGGFQTGGGIRLRF